ncbi:hypothetical protein PMZ80_000662 [Knufia obscura]|uniref:Uncharacterized protein n=1 Tax=Knufia obscura TaxID=1635080 RepID=A0ABR0S1Z7_9EURO|nr:hypothetical protein PMZ80_000662 [Knufia obscura]
MSTTSTITAPTATSQPISVHELLRAYEVHQTGQDEVNIVQALAVAERRPATQLPQHANEPTPVTPPQPDEARVRRRQPPIRPASRGHTLSSRPAGIDGSEAAFVLFMFAGVYMVGLAVPKVPVLIGALADGKQDLAKHWRKSW